MLGATGVAVRAAGVEREEAGALVAMIATAMVLSREVKVRRCEKLCNVLAAGASSRGFLLSAVVQL